MNGIKQVAAKAKELYDRLLQRRFIKIERKGNEIVQRNVWC